jgi:hypothetical protein
VTLDEINKTPIKTVDGRRNNNNTMILEFFVNLMRHGMSRETKSTLNKANETIKNSGFLKQATTCKSALR